MAYYAVHSITMSLRESIGCALETSPRRCTSSLPPSFIQGTLQWTRDMCADMYRSTDSKGIDTDSVKG